MVIELKYPRDSRSGISPDTMTLGELLRDFLRVAAVPADQPWVVQILNPRLQRFLHEIVDCCQPTQATAATSTRNGGTRPQEIVVRIGIGGRKYSL